jgi:hypothetical protein
MHEKTPIRGMTGAFFLAIPGGGNFAIPGGYYYIISHKGEKSNHHG